MNILDYNTIFRGSFHFNLQPSQEIVNDFNDFCLTNSLEIKSYCPWCIGLDDEYRFRYIKDYNNYNINEIVNKNGIPIKKYKNVNYNTNELVLRWNGCYNQKYFNWLTYLLYGFFIPHNIVLNGIVEYCGDKGDILENTEDTINKYTHGLTQSENYDIIFKENLCNYLIPSIKEEFIKWYEDKYYQEYNEKLLRRNSSKAFNYRDNNILSFIEMKINENEDIDFLEKMFIEPWKETEPGKQILSHYKVWRETLFNMHSHYSLDYKLFDEKTWEDGEIKVNVEDLRKRYRGDSGYIKITDNQFSFIGVLGNNIENSLW